MGVMSVSTFPVPVLLEVARFTSASRAAAEDIEDRAWAEGAVRGPDDDCRREAVDICEASNVEASTAVVRMLALLVSLAGGRARADSFTVVSITGSVALTLALAAAADASTPSSSLAGWAASLPSDCMVR